MSIRKKTVVIVSITFFILWVALIVTSRIVVLGGFSDLEAEYVRLNVENMKSEFSSILSNLNATSGDWAAWDTTYAFIEEHGNEYIERNLMDATFTNLKINFMLFINNAGQLGFGKAVDLIKGKRFLCPQTC